VSAERNESVSLRLSGHGRGGSVKFRQAPASLWSLLWPTDPEATGVLTALGVTATSQDRSALLSANMATVEQSMLAVGVDRIAMINTLLASLRGSLRAVPCDSFPGCPAE
jgi:hypothetical protein